MDIPVSMILQSYTKKNLLNLTQFLFLTSIFSLIIVYIQWLWGRRKLYIYANQVHGPFSLPIIGCAYLFIGQTSDTYKNLQYILNKYPKLTRAWFGHRLFYGVQDPKYLEIIMNSPKALAKEMLYKQTEVIVGKGLFTAPVKQWKKNRKIIRPTFNQKILDQFVEVFAEQGEILINQLKTQCDKNIDIFQLMVKASLDIICETAMGVKVQAQTTDSEFGRWADRAMEIAFLKMFVIWYHVDFIFNLTPLKKELDDIAEKLHAFTTKVVVEKRLAYEKQMEESNYMVQTDESPRRKAFLDYLIEVTHTKEGSIFTDKELEQEVVTFMIAGSDTTASSSCFLLMSLGMFPEIQDKVYKEIIDVLGPDRAVATTDLPHLNYLECVIKETLRLFPVGAFIVRSIEEDLDLGDAILPAGSSAVIGIINVQRNPKYWPEPFKFIPERFMPPNSDNIVPASYMPFSYGLRNCIGPKYAMMAMKSVVATVLREYSVTTDYKCIEDVELKTNLVLRPKNGFKVRLHRR